MPASLAEENDSSGPVAKRAKLDASRDSGTTPLVHRSKIFAPFRVGPTEQLHKSFKIQLTIL